MVTLCPLTLQLYPDEYLSLANHCQYYATLVIAMDHPPKDVPNTYLLLADVYGRLFSFARLETWKRRRRDKKYSLKLSILYVRLFHQSLQGRCESDAQQRVLTQLDQLLA